MCEACNNGNPWAVSLTRKGPKNNGKIPADWLIGHDLQEGYYDIVDESPVYDDDENTVGYIVEYAGARKREYSQGAFTLKTANDECHQCSRGLAEYHLELKYANLGCECGNIAYAGRNCIQHPLPSLESRWIRLNQGGDYFCNHCQARLAQESWSMECRNYCNQTCKDNWEIAYEARMAKWRKEMGRE